MDNNPFRDLISEFQKTDEINAQASHEEDMRFQRSRSEMFKLHHAVIFPALEKMANEFEREEVFYHFTNTSQTADHLDVPVTTFTFEANGWEKIRGYNFLFTWQPDGRWIEAELRHGTLAGIHFETISFDELTEES